jgi:PPOX class probable F420-dependent enzyme
MAADSSDPFAGLTASERGLVTAARTATLATIDDQGRPRLVPICFVLDAVSTTVWSPLDEKPKAVRDVRSLARVRDIVDRPAVTLLVDRWSEDWTELAWVRLHGEAALIEAGEAPTAVIDALRVKYPQYASHDLEHRPLIRIAITATTSWRP